ncbi:hypothetical protein BS47DRAFT_1383375 [Hydnum rufescens UP504]|uniref:DUF6534 domain-containing protein n=1 Tax=Hydnum rufescens UP504 TaxID=1448309 RepID=A0A9P6ATV9_9AGAM|nr:hypothetical protein BS47DRAFT_1383375 [Hydnum rufescens UP504]
MPSFPFIMAIMDVSQVNILAGSFVGILLTALLVSSSLKHGQDSAGLIWRYFSPYFLEMWAFYGCCKLLNCWCPLFGALQLFPGNNVETCYWPTPSMLYSACSTQTVYRWSVTNCNNPSALEWETWEFGMGLINNVLLHILVGEVLHSYFPFISIVSANIYIGVLVEALVFLQFGFGAALSVKAPLNQEFKVIVKECTWLVVSWLAIQATADIVIATCMSLLLRHRRTGSQKTDSVINRMALYTISTGLITSVLSCFLLAMVHFSHFVSFCSMVTGFFDLHLPLGACYCITMLANLHMRTRLRARLAAPSPLELIGTIKKRMGHNAGDHRNEATFQATRINITTAVVNDVVEMPPHILQGPDFPNN